MKKILLIISILLSMPVSALTILNDAHIIDGTGRPAIEHGAIWIKNDKIIAVNHQPLTKFPKGARVISMTGKTIMPALINAHGHLGLTKGTTTSDANNTPENVTTQLKRYAQYGVGTVLSLGRDQLFIYKMRNQKDTGLTHILSAGQGFGVPNAMPPALKQGYDPVYRPEEIKQIKSDMKQLAAYRPTLVKLWLDDWYGTMPKMSPSYYQAIIKEAHHHKLSVAGHIFYLEDATNLIKSGIDILAHSVRDKVLDKNFIKLMKKHHVAYIPTLDLDEAYFIYTDKPSWMNTEFFKNALEPGVWEMLHLNNYPIKEREREYLATAKTNLKLLFDAGIPIAMGTDSGAIPSRLQGFAEHRELQLMVSAGLTPAQVIHIATGATATILKIAKKRGTITPGKQADLLILNENPLVDIHHTENIYAVWLNGKEISRA